jgi:hypothetical protein
MSELKDIFNAMRQGPVHEACICGYTIYKPNERHYSCGFASSIVVGVRSMCELILCPKNEHDEYHKLHCIKGECNNCGISKLQFCPTKVDPNNDMFIHWKRFENVCVGHFEDGGDYHAIQLQSKMSLTSKFIAYLKPMLTKKNCSQF